MKDQVESLVRSGVKAANLDSTLTLERSTWVKGEVLSGAMKILYVAPERYVCKFRYASHCRLMMNLDKTKTVQRGKS